MLENNGFVSAVNLNGAIINTLVQLDEGCDRHGVYRGVNHMTGEREVVKIFYRRDLNALSRSIYNHFTRSRDGYKEFFDEIEPRLQGLDFFPTLLDCGIGEVFNLASRRVVGQYPMLRMAFCDGIPLLMFLETNRHNSARLLDIAGALGQRLWEMHRENLAHGDPHLGNLLLAEEGGSRRLVFTDLNMLHAPEFSLCRQFHCFTPFNRRHWEDLENQFKSIGRGFRRGLAEFGRPLGIDRLLVEAFNGRYFSQPLM